MKASIRHLAPGDHASVQALAHRLTEGVAPWREPSAVGHAVRRWVEDALARADRSGHPVFVAELDEAVVGFATATGKRHWSGATDTYIGELAVAQDAEGKGVGRALVGAVIEWGRSQSHDRIILQTGAGNARARGFYEAIGFEEEDVTLSRGL